MSSFLNMVDWSGWIEKRCKYGFRDLCTKCFLMVGIVQTIEMHQVKEKSLCKEICVLHNLSDCLKCGTFLFWFENHDFDRAWSNESDSLEFCEVSCIRKLQ